jgi:hypothetical protein
MSADYNLNNWPVVYIKLSSNQISDESFEEYKKAYLSLLVKCKNNNDKIILICDLNNSSNLPINYVMKQAQFTKDINKFNKEYVKAVCILCSDKNFKNMLNLYFTLCKPATPYKLCRSFNKINKYLIEKHDIIFDSNIYDTTLIKNDIIEEEEEENIEYNTKDSFIEDSDEQTNYCL